jgi:hypothetical protein
MFLSILLLSFLSGEILGFESVVFNVFDFIHALVESSKFKAVVKTHLEQLLYFLLVYMEITEDQVCKVLMSVLTLHILFSSLPIGAFH